MKRNQVARKQFLTSCNRKEMLVASDVCDYQRTLVKCITSMRHSGASILGGSKPSFENMLYKINVNYSV